jgi:hypothetical protein
MSAAGGLHSGANLPRGGIRHLVLEFKPDEAA